MCLMLLFAREINKVSKMQSDNSSLPEDVWVYPENITSEDTKSSYNKANSKKGTDGESYIISEGSGGDISLYAEALLYTLNGDSYNLSTVLSSTGSGQRKGALLPIVNMPPTLVVEKDEDISNRYTVKFYVNPEIFGLDLNNKYIAYIKSRDTPVDGITVALDQSRSSSYD